MKSDCEGAMQAGIQESGPGWLRRLVGRGRRWVFLNVWCRHLYRPVMKLMHRFNLHYAPPSPMSPAFGKRDHWCQWCGLRGNTWTYDPEAPVLPPNTQVSDPAEPDSLD